MMQRQELLAVWAKLRAYILALKPFLENESLIIEALEFHLHHASSLTSENSSESLLDQRWLKKEKETLTRELEEHPQGERDTEHLESIRQRILLIDQSLNDTTIQSAFNSQKLKNEQIVKDCQELLTKLNQIHD